MKLSQFKFKLPEEKIALYPAKYRDESRLMVIHKSTGEIEHVNFKDILNYFDDKDVFIFNDTKVFPARLYGNKEKTGARIEVFLLRELNEELRLWDVLVDPARKIRIGNKLYFGDDDSMVAEVIDNTTSPDVHSAFCTTVLMMNSRRLCMPWENLHCLLSSIVRQNRKTKNVSRLSTPKMKEPLPYRQPVFTSAVNL